MSFLLAQNGAQSLLVDFRKAIDIAKGEARDIRIIVLDNEGGETLRPKLAYSV